MQLVKQLEILGHSAAIYTIDGYDDFVFTGSGDKFVAKWNLITGTQEKFAIKADDAVYKILLVNSASQLIIGTAKGAMHVIDLAQRQEIKHLVQHRSAIFCFLENPLTQHIYSADADGNLAIWEANTWKLLLFLPLDCGKIRSIELSEEGNQFFVGSQDGKIRLFNAHTFNELEVIDAHKDGCNALCLLSDKQLLSGGKDAFIKVWNCNDQLKVTREIPAHNFAVYQLIKLRNGANFISISRDKTIKLWDSETLSVLQRIERKHGGHSHAVNAVYKKNESAFVTVGDDKRIIYWNLEDSE